MRLWAQVMQMDAERNRRQNQAYIHLSVDARARRAFSTSAVAARLALLNSAAVTGV